MLCSNCSSENPDGSNVCKECGADLQASTAENKTCGLAITALVLALLSIFFNLITALPAILCAIIALVQISKSKGQLKGEGMAVTSIVISIVVPLIMLSITIPKLNIVKGKARRIVCGTNLKGLSTAMLVYSQDYDDLLPTAERWCDLLMDEADVSLKSLQCPGEEEGHYSYAFNKSLSGKATYVAQDVVLLFEADLGKNGVGGREDMVLRHDMNSRKGCNILFVDSTSAFVTEDMIELLNWEP